MAYLPGQQYVQNSSGAWLPVGYGSTGTLSVPVTQRDPNTGRSVMISSFAALIAVPQIGLINSTFYDSASLTNNYTLVNTGSGAVSANTTDGYFTMTSGTTASSTSKMTSNDTANYNGIGPLLFLNGLRLPQAGVAGLVRRWGYYNDSNGYFFEDNAGTLRVVSRKAGVDTPVASGSFNGVVDGVTVTTRALDTTSHFYTIEMTGGRAVFSIDFTPVHTIAPSAAATTTSATLNLPVRVEISASPGTTAYTIEGRGQNVARLGTVDSKRLTETLFDVNDSEVTRAVMTGRSAADTFNTAFITATGQQRLDVVMQATTGTASGNIFRARVNPTTITASTALVAAPGVGLSLYLTDINVSNAGATANTVSLLDGATGIWDVMAASSGGGAAMNFRTPIKLTAATALNYTTSAASSTFVTVTGYIAP